MISSDVFFQRHMFKDLSNFFDKFTILNPIFIHIAHSRIQMMR